MSILQVKTEENAASVIDSNDSQNSLGQRPQNSALSKSASRIDSETIVSKTSQSAARMQTNQAQGRTLNFSERQLRAVKVKHAELILFTTQLSVMLDSGVVLSDALDAIAEQAEQGPFKAIIMNTAETVKRGENFSKVLAIYPKVFSSMFISMVKASEASGKMVEMLKVLSGYLNFEFETRKRVKAALTYPAIMAMMAVTATSILMFFVLPRFTRIYDAKGAALPKLTQILVGISRMFSDPQTTMTILTTLMLAAMGLYYWVGTTAGKKTVDYIKINTPVIGTMFVDVLVTRSMRIMATMLNTGVSLLDAITVIQGSCKNYYFQQLWSQAKDKIHDGYQLSESLQISMDQGRTRAKLIAPGIIQMLKAGEKGGNLGMVSDKISDFYEDKLKGSIKTVTSLIEPIMIIVMGSIIGTIAIALLMPVFKISTVMSR